MSWLRAMRRADRARGGGSEWGCCALLAMSVLACISTDLNEPDATPPLPVCGSNDAAGGGSAAVVQLIANRRGSAMWCSGVAVAPTLVITALGCIAEAGDPLQSDPIEEVLPTSEPASDVDYAAVADYSAICDRDDGWALREQGNFSAWLGDIVQASSIDVYRLPPGFDLSDPETYQVVKAVDVITSRSASRCRDDIAVLLLEEPLDLPPATVSLGDGGDVGAGVIISNFCANEDGLPAVVDTPSQLLAYTRNMAQPMLPPRSLLVSGELDYNAPGGAVYATGSNALIGIIVSGTKDGCAAQTADGASIATHLGPYRRMIFDAAIAADEVLRLDADSADASLGDLGACTAR